MIWLAFMVAIAVTALETLALVVVSSVKDAVYDVGLPRLKLHTRELFSKPFSMF